MKVLVIGYGYYVFGNTRCIGGTVMPAIQEWKRRNNSKNLDLDILVRSGSFEKAQGRLNTWLSLNRELNGISISIVTKCIKEYDCAIIAVPEVAHESVLKNLSNVDKVICVKPVGRNYDDFTSILQISRERKIDFYVDFHKRYDPANVYIMEELRNSRSGEFYFTFSYGQKREMVIDYFNKWYATSNPFQYLGPHYLDLILKGTGLISEHIDINGEVNVPIRDAKGVPMLVIGYLMLSSGEKNITIQFDINWNEPNTMPYSSRQRLEVMADDIRIASEQDNRGILDWSDVVQIPNPHYRVESNLGSVGYGIEIYNEFLNAVAENRISVSLPTILEYENVAKIINFVNNRIHETN